MSSTVWNILRLVFHFDIFYVRRHSIIYDKLVPRKSIFLLEMGIFLLVFSYKPIKVPNKGLWYCNLVFFFSPLELRNYWHHKCIPFIPRLAYVVDDADKLSYLHDPMVGLMQWWQLWIIKCSGSLYMMSWKINFD